MNIVHRPEGHENGSSPDTVRRRGSSPDHQAACSSRKTALRGLVCAVVMSRMLAAFLLASAALLSLSILHAAGDRLFAPDSVVHLGTFAPYLTSMDTHLNETGLYLTHILGDSLMGNYVTEMSSELLGLQGLLSFIQSG